METTHRTTPLREVNGAWQLHDMTTYVYRGFPFLSNIIMLTPPLQFHHKGNGNRGAITTAPQEGEWYTCGIGRVPSLGLQPDFIEVICPITLTHWWQFVEGGWVEEETD